MHVRIVVDISFALMWHFNAPLCAFRVHNNILPSSSQKIIHIDLIFALCNKQAHLVHSLFAADRCYIWPYFLVCIPIHQ